MNKGDLIIIPTDTVYGLAAKLYDEEALKKIFEIKGREQSKQIPILCHDMTDLIDIVELDQVSLFLMKQFWPGPITFVFNTTEKFHQLTGEKTIAARIPNHPKALEIIKKYGVLRVTSLNKSGEPPLSDINEIKDQFGSMIDEIYEQTEDQSHVSSTVVDLTVKPLKILRQGTITEESIKNALNALQSYNDC
ncbi:MAG: threonylcarbamoyl-AMP synthase [Acholeplasmataceae bacterium]|nr:threonylcarbamoyl-AMP synthase [Acholeplasmataceae bacterium]